MQNFVFAICDANKITAIVRFYLTLSQMISIINQETRQYLQKMDEAIAEFVNHSLEKHQQASSAPYTEAHTIINSLDKVKYKSIIDHYNDKLAKKWQVIPKVSKIVTKLLKYAAKQSLPQPNDTGSGAMVDDDQPVQQVAHQHSSEFSSRLIPAQQRQRSPSRTIFR